MEFAFKGDVNIIGNLRVTGTSVEEIVQSITTSDTIIGLGTPTPGSGYDGGVIIQRNPTDITNVDLSGTAVSATATTLTITQTGFSNNYFTGWIIKIVGGIGANQNSLVISSVDNVLTTAIWPTTPNNTSLYTLSRETNVGIIYKTISDTFFMGTTPSAHSANTIIPAVPKSLLVKRIVQTQQESVYYVGKHGSNTNGGRTIADAFLTFGAAITASSTGDLIICFDSGNYAESVVANDRLIYAPNATITTASFTLSRAMINQVNDLTITTSQINVNYFTSATIGLSILTFDRAGEITVTDSSYINGKELYGSTGISISDCNVYGSITVISSTTAISVENGEVVLVSSSITSTTLANTNLTGIAHITAGHVVNSAVTGSGSVYYIDAQRVQNHITNTSNPHNVTIAQVSPLSAKGDLLAYSNANIAFPVGSNSQILSANSAQPSGLQWIDNNPPTFQNFAVAAGKYFALNSSQTIGTFVWRQSSYSNLVNGTLVFYNSGACSISFIGSQTYVSQTIASAGYQSIPITLPTSDDIINFNISSTGTNTFVYNVVLTFGSASSTISASTAFDYRTVSSSYSVLTSDDHIICNTSTNPITLTLPAAFKKKYVIMDSGSAFTNNITISPTGGALINGAPSYIIGTNYAGKTLFSNSVNWYIY